MLSVIISRRSFASDWSVRLLGPNLLRVSSKPGIEVAGSATATRSDWAVRGRYRACERRPSSAMLDDDEWTRRHRHAGVLTCRARHPKPDRGQAHVRREAARHLQRARDQSSSCRRQGQALMCGHTSCTAGGQGGEAMLEQRMLGNVYFVSSSRVNLGLHQRDASVIWDLGPHDFSILLHWLGELPQTVRAIGRDSVVPGITDVAFITLTFASGVVANVELSWLAPSKLRRTVVVGSQKMVVYDDGAVEPVRVFDHGVVYEDPETFGEYHLSYRTGDILSPSWRDTSAVRRARRLRRSDPLRRGPDDADAARSRRRAHHRSSRALLSVRRRADRAGDGRPPLRAADRAGAGRG